ncbi:hypothetical protein KR038_000214 [Drosophila bunnanda]|nr:hypothetical protein KR038_000214 [Drosophila bunnanda]
MGPKKKVPIAGAKLPAGKGHCVVCATVAGKACQRCGDFYCSKECQLQDWHRHRYICFPLPALVHPKSFSIHLSESTDELLMEGASSSDKPDKVVGESGSPSPLPPVMECGGTVTKAGNSAGAKSVPVTSAPIPQASNSIVSNNTLKSKNKQNSPPKAILPKSNSLVFISGFRSPNRCYIRDASEIADKAFATMCEKVNVMGSDMPIMAEARTHDYCLALYNGMFHRASVINKTGHNTARLLFFDLGIVQSRNLSDMREINKELLSLPSFSVQVHLKNVSNYVISKNVIEFLSRFEGEKFLVIYTKSPGAINVELLDPETKISLNTRICEFCKDQKVFENPFVAKENWVEEKTPKQQNPNAGVALNKPNPIPETSAPSNNKNKTSTEKKMEIEAENGSSISVQGCESAKIELEEKLYETKDIARTDYNPQNDDCAKESDGSTEGAKATSEIQSLILSEKPKAIETSLDMNKNGRAPSPLSKGEDKDVADFLTRCRVSKPTMPGSDPTKEKTPLSEQLKEQLEGQKLQENGIVGALLVPPFKMLRFNISSREGIDVYVVDVSKIVRGIFGAFDSSFASEFSTLHSRMAEITDSKPYKPALKEFVLARFEGSWYRGRVENVKVTPKRTEYRVMYLDYTNAADVTEQDIRQYPLDFTTPCTTNICMIDGFPHKPSQAQLAYLSETVKVHHLLHVDAAMYLSIQSDIAVIKSRPLIEKLMSL